MLPQERDPDNLAQPLTVILGGDSYIHTSRWQQLAVRQPIKRLNEKLTLLRAKLNRPDFNLSGAYVDRLILNVCCGPGQIDVYIDDLEVGPVLDAKQAGPGDAARNVSPQATSQAPNNRRAAVVELKGNPQQLFVADGQKLFIRGIRHTGTPLKTLSDALFNVIWVDESTPQGLLEDAANLGFWIVPSLTPPMMTKPGEATLTANEAFGRKVALRQQRGGARLRPRRRSGARAGGRHRPARPRLPHRRPDAAANGRRSRRLRALRPRRRPAGDDRRPPLAAHDLHRAARLPRLAVAAAAL